MDIQDIWRPGTGLAGTGDSTTQVQDILCNPGRVATLVLEKSKCL